MREREDGPEWSTWTVNGERQTWQQMYEREHEQRLQADRWGILVSDLDRCEHGRHEDDVCSGCGGPSLGNALLPEGTTLGHSLSGAPYVVPARMERHRIESWTASRHDESSPAVSSQPEPSSHEHLGPDLTALQHHGEGAT